MSAERCGNGSRSTVDLTQRTWDRKQTVESQGAQACIPQVCTGDDEGSNRPVGLTQRLEWPHDFYEPGTQQTGSKGAQQRPVPAVRAVLARHPVEVSELVRWRPSGPAKYYASREVTKAEGELLANLQDTHGVSGLRDLGNITLEAVEAADVAYERPAEWKKTPLEWSTNGHNDAFRHAYWSARLGQAFGENWARSFTSAHEGRPDNSEEDKAADLFNNNVGLGIGRAHPNAPPERVAELVAEAVERGRLLVRDQKGSLAWSDRVPVGKHFVAGE